MRILLYAWDWRPDIILVLVLAGVIYVRGWWHLRNRPARRSHRRAQLAAGWRLGAHLSGLAVLVLALVSPIDFLGGQLFSMHMVQHLLLMMLAPPLLLIANPLPFALWGMPAGARREMGRLLKPMSASRHLLRTLTRPGVVWMVFIAVFLGWHDPHAYDAALRIDWVHDLEHITFFGASMLFWWHVTRAGPHIHGEFSPGLRVAYLLATVPINMLTGVAIAFAGKPIYSYYTAVPRVWGMTVMQDQMLGGVIMWIPGSMMFILAALILIAHQVQDEENKPSLPESKWATDEAMIAPRWKAGASQHH